MNLYPILLIILIILLILSAILLANNSFIFSMNGGKFDNKNIVRNKEGHKTGGMDTVLIITIRDIIEKHNKIKNGKSRVLVADAQNNPEYKMGIFYDGLKPVDDLQLIIEPHKLLPPIGDNSPLCQIICYYILNNSFVSLHAGRELGYIDATKYTTNFYKHLSSKIETSTHESELAEAQRIEEELKQFVQNKGSQMGKHRSFASYLTPSSSETEESKSSSEIGISEDNMIALLSINRSICTNIIDLYVVHLLYTKNHFGYMWSSVCIDSAEELLDTAEGNKIKTFMMHISDLVSKYASSQSMKLANLCKQIITLGNSQLPDIPLIQSILNNYSLSEIFSDIDRIYPESAFDGIKRLESISQAYGKNNSMLDSFSQILLDHCRNEEKSMREEQMSHMRAQKEEGKESEEDGYKRHQEFIAEQEKVLMAKKEQQEQQEFSQSSSSSGLPSMSALALAFGYDSGAAAVGRSRSSGQGPYINIPYHTIFNGFYILHKMPLEFYSINVRFLELCSGEHMSGISDNIDILYVIFLKSLDRHMSVNINKKNTFLGIMAYNISNIMHSRDYEKNIYSFKSSNVLTTAPRFRPISERRHQEYEYKRLEEESRRQQMHGTSSNSGISVSSSELSDTNAERIEAYMENIAKEKEERSEAVRLTGSKTQAKKHNKYDDDDEEFF